MLYDFLPLCPQTTHPLVSSFFPLLSPYSLGTSQPNPLRFPEPPDTLLPQRLKFALVGTLLHVSSQATSSPLVAPPPNVTSEISLTTLFYTEHPQHSPVSFLVSFFSIKSLFDVPCHTYLFLSQTHQNIRFMRTKICLLNVLTTVFPDLRKKMTVAKK